jgi:CRP-like cAMP-binding protein
MMETTLLSDFPIFAGMPPEVFEAIARDAVVRSHEAGSVLFEEGDMASELFGLLEGEVELSILFRDRVLKADVRHEEYVHKRFEIIETELVFDTIEPGEIFAWSALVAPHQLTSNARCTQPSKVMALPAGSLADLFEQAPRSGSVFMQRLAGVIAQRLRHRTDKLVESWYEAFGEERL